MVLVLAVLLAIKLDLKSKLFPGAKEIKTFDIADVCSIVLNNIIHQIPDDSACRIMCQNDCGIRKLDFYSSEFESRENNCHLCKCSCT